MGSLIRATNLWGYPELVREIGGDPAPLYARFHISEGIEQLPDAFVPFGALARLVETSAEELGCPDFGLRLSRWQGLAILGPVAVIARNAHTVLDGLTAVGRYLYVHSPALKLTLAPPSTGAELSFGYEMIDPTMPVLRQSYELSMGNAAGIVRLLGGADARLASVSFTHEQIGPDSGYAETFGCPVRFGQTDCGFQISASLAGRTIDSADPETRRLATKYLDTEYLPGEATLTEQVAMLARRLLPVGQCTAEVIADHLAMHPRTLQRRLADEGARCQDVIDAQRRSQAERYLAEPRLYLGQIAGLLGYSEQASLNRACRRWFGKTPREYRSELAAT